MLARIPMVSYSWDEDNGCDPMLSTGLDELDKLLKGGYPDKSAILVVGPPGIGKEALRYWFIQNGLNREDFGLYVTRLAVSEDLQDLRAVGLSGLRRPY